MPADRTIPLTLARTWRNVVRIMSEKWSESLCMTQSPFKNLRNIVRRLSRFDLFVLSIVLLLIIAVLIVAVLGGMEDSDTLQIAYLVPGGANVTNVWVADLDAPEDARQVTFASIGVESFTVSPDGQFIVYAERDFESGTTELRRVNLRNGVVDTLTHCIEESSVCTSPVYSPDGNKIAYERRTIGRAVNAGNQSERMWILDLSTAERETYPIIDEPDILGISATWSGNGDKLAFYDRSNAGFMIYDFVAAANGDTSTTFIPSGFDVASALSPDGTQFVFPEILLDENLVRSYLQIADLDTLQFQVLTQPGENADDRSSVWRPDGTSLAISRRYLRGERATAGPQIFLLDVRDGSLDPLIFDADYSHGIFSWSPDGRYLVLQRSLIANANTATPEIWVYDMDTRRLTQIAENAFSPRWVP